MIANEDKAMIHAEMQAFVSSMAARGFHVVGGVVAKPRDGEKAKVLIFASAPEGDMEKHYQHVTALITLLYNTITKVAPDTHHTMPIGTN